MKQKRRKKRKQLKRSLLHLLNKINQQLKVLEKMIPARYFTPQYRRRRSAIEQIYLQQAEMFEQGVRKIANRIVSIDKPYIRPIVRGKENRPV